MFMGSGGSYVGTAAPLVFTRPVAPGTIPQMFFMPPKVCCAQKFFY